MPCWGRSATDIADPLDLDLPERKLILDPEGKLVERQMAAERLDAHRLIEEFMILASIVAAAETLEAAHSPLIYRAHDAPSPEKIGALGEFLCDPRRQARQGRAHAPRTFQSRCSDASRA